jgi:dihydroneopterin aldolase
MMRIYFRRFEIKARLGVLDHERQGPQRVLIDLDFTPRELNPTRDELTGVLDYRLVKKAIETVIIARHYDLLEHLAHELVQALIAQFDLNFLRLSLEKPDIFADMEAVGVCLEYQHE